MSQVNQQPGIQSTSIQVELLRYMAQSPVLNVNGNARAVERNNGRTPPPPTPEIAPRPAPNNIEMPAIVLEPAVAPGARLSR